MFQRGSSGKRQNVASRQPMQTRGGREKKEEKRELTMRIRTEFTEGGTLVGWSVIWRLSQGLNVV